MERGEIESGLRPGGTSARVGIAGSGRTSVRVKLPVWSDSSSFSYTLAMNHHQRSASWCQGENDVKYAYGVAESPSFSAVTFLCLFMNWLGISLPPFWSSATMTLTFTSVALGNKNLFQ